MKEQESAQWQNPQALLGEGARGAKSPVFFST
jgi:hypothetical protein